MLYKLRDEVGGKKTPGGYAGVICFDDCYVKFYVVKRAADSPTGGMFTMPVDAFRALIEKPAGAVSRS